MIKQRREMLTTAGAAGLAAVDAAMRRADPVGVERMATATSRLVEFLAARGVSRDGLIRRGQQERHRQERRAGPHVQAPKLKALAGSGSWSAPVRAVQCMVSSSPSRAEICASVRSLNDGMTPT